MSVGAGQIILADHINRAQPVTYSADASGTLTLSTSNQDVAGAAITFNTAAANAVFVAFGNFDMFVQAVSGTVTHLGKLSVDGVVQAKAVPFTGDFTGARAGVEQTWRGTLAAAGSHTIKLVGAKDTGAGTYQIIGGSTGLVVQVFEVV